MPTPLRALVTVVVVSGLTLPSLAQDDPTLETEDAWKPVITGRQHAVTSMKHQATEAAVRDPREGRQRVRRRGRRSGRARARRSRQQRLRQRRRRARLRRRGEKVWSINAEGTAPRLATIEWYQQNNGGNPPDSDGLLSAPLPGVVDAWYTMLDRWGTMTFAQVLQPAIESPKRVPRASRRLARSMGSPN